MFYSCRAMTALASQLFQSMAMSRLDCSLRDERGLCKDDLCKDEPCKDGLDAVHVCVAWRKASGADVSGRCRSMMVRQALKRNSVACPDLDCAFTWLRRLEAWIRDRSRACLWAGAFWGLCNKVYHSRNIRAPQDRVAQILCDCRLLDLLCRLSVSLLSSCRQDAFQAQRDKLAKPQNSFSQRVPKLLPLRKLKGVGGGRASRNCQSHCQLIFVVPYT